MFKNIHQSKQLANRNNVSLHQNSILPLSTENQFIRIESEAVSWCLFSSYSAGKSRDEARRKRTREKGNRAGCLRNGSCQNPSSSLPQSSIGFQPSPVWYGGKRRGGPRRRRRWRVGSQSSRPEVVRLQPSVSPRPGSVSFSLGGYFDFFSLMWESLSPLVRFERLLNLGLYEPDAFTLIALLTSFVIALLYLFLLFYFFSIDDSFKLGWHIVNDT